MKKKNKRILIVRPDRIGDVVLSTPLPREIKKKFPDGYVAVMVREYAKDVYLNNPFIDEIIIYDANNPFLKTVKTIRKYGFTHALMLLPDERINYLLFFAGIPCRVGVGHKLYQFLAFARYVDRNKYNPLRHEADYSLDLARKIGVDSSDYTPEIYLSEEEKKISEIRRKELLNRKKFLIGINSTSGGSAPNWNAERYRKLIELLLSDDNIRVAVTDLEPPESLSGIDSVVYPNVNSTLRNSIINFSALDLLVSASTGPMHICAALKVKTVSLFCPMTACSPKLWGPLGNYNKIILPEENYCKYKCPGDPKKCEYLDSELVTPERVFEEISGMLNKE
ncbi:glycosyl transferase family protein [Melioribacter roseus P3M-2]|uniref:Glycosyl transferase family protein n=1 Tax=Melioribacter roseus (strain DSM 23840 / JCM 17771 / VKM B-2668 / P3M-2) TaxID=1191523 RepID=I6Z811_MELRP|nr:glycosyltransferase family 9 protein [Melioribacter roseus]AFN75305.1 glycosyl transferase family protein [Melioribacter roseus P3M-2]